MHTFDVPLKDFKNKTFILVKEYSDIKCYSKHN